METKNLIIGDLVESDGYIWKVTGVYGFSGMIDLYPIRLKTNDSKLLMPKIIDCSIATPIPLTDEILKANGWWELKDLGDGTYGWGTKHGDYAITYMTHYGLPVLTVEQDNLMKHRTSMTLVDEVYNVHSLQNAYRMCGLNELADNFVIEKGGNNGN